MPLSSYRCPSSAYLAVLKDIAQNAEFISAPRGKKIREKIHYQFTVTNPEMTPIVTKSHVRNVVIAKYTEAEFKLYATGERSAEAFGQASSFWKQLANPDGTVNSAYGHLIFHDKSCGDPDFETHGAMRTPWEWARLALITDRDSRQAIIKFHKAEHLWMGNKDQTCTVYGSFLIRSDRLHFNVHMRSNDVVKGLVYDMPWFCYLMMRMRDELVANGYHNLELGTYTHIADSMHIYESDIHKVWDMIGLTEP